MANRKDMRRDDLIVPYMEPEKESKDSQDIQGTMASTLPMAAIFTRNKLIGWTAVLFSIQAWLSETPAQKAASSTPSYFSVGMSAMSVAVAYAPLFLPPTLTPGSGSAANAGTGTGTNAPPAVPV
ncbi:hypothetical protein LTR36_010311 [Oleoguttula mirabilis]|uniref:Uncharacterized protein n=1 Tax=Oleoguttula mirabilis TaxID=1507867 RepID=A0AAV9J4H2_9PEZI|nr:hypothetical protein LTR36_010311 [Oleoguttula mirabilis]